MNIVEPPLSGHPHPPLNGRISKSQNICNTITIKLISTYDVLYILLPLLLETASVHGLLGATLSREPH